MTTLQDIMAEAIKATNQYQADLYTASAADPDLTPEANWQRATEARQRLTDAHHSALDMTLTRGESAARSLQMDADRARPHVDTNNSADLMRSEQGWRNVVLPALERTGGDLNTALANADADAVLGAERFAAAWLDANASDPARRGSQGIVNAAVSRRFAELASDDRQRDALNLAGRAPSDLEALRTMVAQLRAGDVTTAAITAHYAGNQNGRTNAANAQRPPRHSGAHYIEV